MQGIAALLARTLRWSGPPHFREFLERQRAELVTRDTHIGELLSRLENLLGGAGIAFVPLKGSALRAMKLHQPGDRPQGDIDLLLDPRDLAACGAFIRTIGYELRYSIRRHEVYARPAQVEAEYFARHTDNPLKIELHTRVSKRSIELVEGVTHKEAIRPGDLTPGANPYASLAALLRHVALHAAGSSRQTPCASFKSTISRSSRPE